MEKGVTMLEDFSHLHSVVFTFNTVWPYVNQPKAVAVSLVLSLSQTSLNRVVK
jgi:hypothetical protein